MDITDTADEGVGTISFISALRRRHFFQNERLLERISGNDVKLITEFKVPVVVSQLENSSFLNTWNDNKALPVQIIKSRLQERVAETTLESFLTQYFDKDVVDDDASCVGIIDDISVQVTSPEIVTRYIRPWIGYSRRKMTLYTKDCYLDWEMNSLGTSSWMYICEGAITFYLIEPTNPNIAVFERWKNSDDPEIDLLTLLKNGGINSVVKIALTRGQALLIPTGWIYASLSDAKSVLYVTEFFHSFNIPLQLRIFEKRRNMISNKNEIIEFQDLNWSIASGEVTKTLGSLNQQSISAPESLIKGAKSLVTNLRTWLSSSPYENGTEILKDLNREIRNAEKILLKNNPPPKPERESKRKKIKKTLDDDFVDITSTKINFMDDKPPAKRKKKINNNDDDKDEDQGPSSPANNPPIKKIIIKNNDKRNVSPIKLTLNRSSILTKPEVNYDLTNRDSVRQLLSNKSSSNFQDLNNALGDCLASFSEDDEESSSSSLVINDKKGIKLKLLVKKSTTPSSVHQDKDFIYPSLHDSDNESGSNSPDKAWNPKVKVKNVVPLRSTIPPRRKEVPAIAKGLATAAACSSSSSVLTTKKLPSKKNVDKPAVSGYVSPPSASSSSSSSAMVKKKKGLSTPKQRLGKLLKLKF